MKYVIKYNNNVHVFVLISTNDYFEYRNNELYNFTFYLQICTVK